jgi:MFS family permease
MPSSTVTDSKGAFLGGPLFLTIVCGCLASLITFGLRSSFGLFTAPLSAEHGWTRDVFALALAIQNLLWGVGQPIAGVLADRFGTARVLAGGGLLYAAGVALTPYSATPLALYATAGVLVGLGMGGASTMTVMAAFGRLVPAERRSWALGIGTAAGSLGQFLVVPLAQAFISAYGWQQALLLLAGLVALVPAFAPGLRGDARTAPTPATSETSFGEALREAFGHTSYLLLVAGFFVCGFQLAFVTVHLPPYLTDAGASPSLAAWAIGVVGLFNIVGSYASGVLGGRHSKRLLLSGIYLGRALTTALFILLPITPASVLLFSATMGLLWLSTVPLTSGLVAVMFGTRYMATLFGLVFFSHQIGSFVGVWLGGALFERTGSYEVVWWISVALSLAATLVHLPIVERPVRQALATAQ